MIEFHKKYIKTIRLNSFHPLCETEIGRQAVNKYGCLPFIDSSCRREPDFENDFPSVTSLCRQKLFAPNLFANDIIVYITTKGSWLTNFNHYRLVAILVVIDRKDSHYQASLWYNSKGIKIPSNCMTLDSHPFPFEMTGGNYNKLTDIKNYLSYSDEKKEIIGNRKIHHWNKEYLERSKKWGTFIITKPIFKELVNPPILTDDDMRLIFGKVPNTRNPNIISKEQLKELAKHADVNFSY